MFELYIQYEYWFAAVQLSLAMLGMGATLRVRDFAAVAKNPRGIVVGITLQIIGVPALAALFLWGLELDTGVAIGLALCAAIPGGTMSNVFTFLGRGHVALSIAITGVTTVACLITTPMILTLLVDQHLPADFVMPAGQIAIEIALILLLPLALGMVCLHLFSGFAPGFSKLCIRVSIFVILLIVIGATGAGRVDLDRFGQYNLIVVMGFLAAVSILSWLIPYLFKVKKADSTAINIEATVRNGNLGLLIKASLFPAAVGVSDPIGDNVLFTVLAYGGAALLVGVGQIYLHRFLNRNDALQYPP
ncbi:MAG: BASS family bile acid:Na+ symporter [Halioglobus sp.]|jgi:BASS family bile acid:Na+ symporter